MGKKITVDQLASTVMKELKEFEGMTDEAVEKGQWVELQKAR